MKKVLLLYLTLTGIVCQAQNENTPISTIVKKEIINSKSSKFKTYAGDSILVEIADIEVPENRLANHTNTIQLKLLRLKAKTVTPLSPIVFLAGGPGQSGINYIKEEYFQKLVFQLQQNHDFILLDQRGSGGSSPSLLYKAPDLPVKDIFIDQQKMIDYANKVSQAGADTLKRKSIDIKGYNTEQNAADLNDLRIALGANKINLLAISYGTHLALAAARKYPAFIDNMVLIGTSGPNHMHHLPANYDKQIEKISDLASKDTAVNKEVPDMSQLLKKVLAKLEKSPVRLQIKETKTNQQIEVQLGKFGLQMILRLDAGDSYDFVYFPALLYSIDNGNYNLLREYVEKRYNQFNSGYGSGIGIMRLASGATQARYNQILKEGKSALLGNAMNTPDIYQKNFWGNIDLGDHFRAPFKSNIRTLFVSGTMDSNTPPSNAEEVKKGFTNSTHVIVNYAGHEDMLPNEKVHKAIIEFCQGAKTTSTTIQLPKPKFKPVNNK